MEDKEKRIEEMAKDMCGSEMDCKTCMNVNGNIYQHEPKDCGCWKNAERLLNKKYAKLPEDKVVISREEYEEYRELKFGLILENLYVCKKLIAEEVVGCLRKHLPKDYEHLADWFEEHYAVNKNRELEHEQLKKYLEKPLKQSIKETVEKAFEITKKIIDKKYAIETPWTRATLSNIINQIEKEFAKQFGVEIKE